MATKKTESNYTATIRESSREFSAKERVMFKDLQNATPAVDFAKECREQDGRAIVDVRDWAIIDIHNESADNTDYTVYLFIDANGNKYYTSSEPCWNAFVNIYAEMKDSNEEWGIEFNLIPSKKYSGTEILTCSLV